MEPELFKPLGDGKYAHHIESSKEQIINEQFAKLGKPNKFLVVRDTSVSMCRKAFGYDMSSYGIGKALALYFSKSLTGAFYNTFAEFNYKCYLHQWKGDTVCDQWVNDKCEAYGDPDIRSVVGLFVRMKKVVPESDFPAGVLCISDGEFSRPNRAANFKIAIQRLKDSGFSEEYVNNLRVILWDIPIRDNKRFENRAPNFFYISGIDHSILNFLMNE